MKPHITISSSGSQKTAPAEEAAFAGVPDVIHEAIVRAYVKTASFKPVDDTTLEMIVRPWTEPGEKAAFYRQISQADSRFTDEMQPLYGKISRPVLILWGREDTRIPPEKGETLHETIPNSLFHVISDASHLVIEEQPVRLFEKIRPFLQLEGG